MPSVLDVLDELSGQTDIPPERDLGALGLMETFAQSSEKTRLLVERYGASLSPNLVAALAFLLNRRAEIAESCGLIYLLLEELQLREQPQVLQNCLATVSRQLIYGWPWPPGEPAPASLGAFVLHCFRYRGPEAWIVESSAAELLEGLSARGMVAEVLNREQRASIAEVLQLLRGEADPYVRAEAERALSALQG